MMDPVEFMFITMMSLFIAFLWAPVLITVSEEPRDDVETPVAEPEPAPAEPGKHGFMAGEDA